MRIFYVGQDAEKRQALLKRKGDLILLGFDRWDDYDYKTSFPVQCRIEGEDVHLGAIKILFSEEKVSYQFLDKLVAEGWDGEFPVPGIIYISVPANTTFYEKIDGCLDSASTFEVARLLNDASLKRWIDEDPDSLVLIESDGFRYSLLRERGAQTAYHSVWKLLSAASINVGDLQFRFLDPLGGKQKLNLDFDSEGRLLPHDIHVLIGPNGVGKSQTLMQIVEHWLDLSIESDEDVGFSDSPNINQVVVVSYSPFERFPIDSENSVKQSGKRQDHDIYRYFGLRGWQSVFDEAGAGQKKIRLSQSRPKINASRSLLACLVDDKTFGVIKDWSAKVKTMERVLNTAIDFDYAAVAVDSDVNLATLFQYGQLLFDDESNKNNDFVIKLPEKESKENGSSLTLVPIAADRIDELNSEVLATSMLASKGIYFIKNGKVVELSSGQRLFSYVVINILGAIRRNSLILIDEPELFLHPTLEIAFISMLKDVLKSYRSKALLATHSLVTVRELPRSCVHVFEKEEGELFVNHPPFETFGGDIQRISSYVFGDKSVSKPFEAWIRQQIQEFGTAESLIEALGDDINEEMIIQISAMGAGKW
ncbi:ATP-binding protein [Pseudomonas sp. MAG733B]|uniref:ATP-binding protein n=1 Tax=Pseudomonas sp. MAG733B TaxID=3122079 RepID=UPI0030CE5B8B